MMNKNGFSRCGENYINRLRKEGRYSTAHVYKNALYSFGRYCGTLNVSFKQVTKERLRRYGQYLYECGLKPNTISNYEKEVTAPDFKILMKLCKLFCLPADTMLNTLLTHADLENKSEWLLNVRRNFNLNDVDLPPSPAESIAVENGDHLYVKQLLEQLERKDETIMSLNRRIGRLEYEIELLKKGEGG